MIIQTKYNVGEKVWTYIVGIRQVTINGIEIKVDKEGKTEIVYLTNFAVAKVKESACFTTKKEADEKFKNIK